MTRHLRLTVALALVASAAASSPAQPNTKDPLAEISDPQTLSQLLQWSLANQDLDALHKKAEAMRKAGGGGGGDGVAGLPEPSDASTADIGSTVKALTADRKAELNELYAQMMPDIAKMMQEALTKVLDVSLEDEAREEAVLELQDHVEDIDNARDFKTIGGFEEMARLLTNDGAPLLQAAAAYVLGTAIKNHHELQLHLLRETDALPALLALLRSHADAEVRAKAVYAASALLRNCPEAQASFGQLNGVDTLLAVLADASNAPRRLVRKTLVLVTDLLREQRTTRAATDKERATFKRVQAEADAAYAQTVETKAPTASVQVDASGAVGALPAGAGGAPEESADAATATTATAAGGIAEADPESLKARVQFMMTHAMRTRLLALGYTAEEIHQMDSAAAADILGHAPPDLPPNVHHANGATSSGGSHGHPPGSDGPEFVTQSADGVAVADEAAPPAGGDGLGSLVLWRNASELCAAIVQCLGFDEDLDAQEKALLALDELVSAQLLVHGGEGSGCTAVGVRAAVQRYADKCDALLAKQEAEGGSSDDDDDDGGGVGAGACGELLPVARALLREALQA